MQKKAINVPFEISDASYFSWAVDEEERGTTVEIKLKNINAEVHFDSIVFRNVMLPVRITANKKGVQSLTAILSSGKSRISVPTQHVDKPDQLIFHLEGKRDVHLLNNINRKDMVYY
ncbi:hypothetical protein GM418_25135 [Maribellus comscasis]|uniref:Uncharacterized protein n=1 Tax=Maribellus comscasis TaxID=2681766 RepID=A0A6I6JW36_9BACT|nr:hypothetical protein [Maribellus comscasis]QGY46821.1 hypothetical protein GM418_25135 [Maribellus comscasis]